MTRDRSQSFPVDSPGIIHSLCLNIWPPLPVWRQRWEWEKQEIHRDWGGTKNTRANGSHNVLPSSLHCYLPRMKGLLFPAAHLPYPKFFYFGGLILYILIKGMQGHAKFFQKSTKMLSNFLLTWLTLFKHACTSRKKVLRDTNRRLVWVSCVQILPEIA